MKHKIEVKKGDRCITDLIVTSKQPEGWYEYIPFGGDEITLNVYNDKGENVYTDSIIVEGENAQRISIDMPSTLDAGRYTYDIVLTRTLESDDEEQYTICDKNIYIIKEDDANA